jgi:hypothetical protein
MLRTTGARLGNVRPFEGLDRIPEMEPKMIKLKLLSTAALMALALPLAMSSGAFAQEHGGKGGYARGGGASFSGGGMRGGGAATAGQRFSGGGGMSAGTRFNGGAGPGFSGRVAATSTSPSYSGNWQGGNRNWQGGNWQGGNRWAGGGYDRRYRRGGGFWPGVAVGAAIGGSYAYYGGPGYYDPGYYDDGYYNDSYYYDDSVAVAAAPEGGDAAYCAQTYRSYDPASGTYLGYDGQRHPCP